METLFSNHYCEINIEKSLNYAEVVYFEETAKMNKEDFKLATMKVVEYFKVFMDNSVTRVLIDARCNYYAVSPELQKWTAEQFTPFNNCFRIATMVSKDLIAALSIEQVVEEFDGSVANPNENCFFEDIESAKKWLFV